MNHATPPSKQYLATSLRVMLCIAIASGFLYQYIDKQNDLIELRRMIPLASKELKTLKEENIRIQYEISRFENPQNLFELIKNPEFSHLKWPNTMPSDSI